VRLSGGGHCQNAGVRGPLGNQGGVKRESRKEGNPGRGIREKRCLWVSFRLNGFKKSSKRKREVEKEEKKTEGER